MLYTNFISANEQNNDIYLMVSQFVTVKPKFNFFVREKRKNLWRLRPSLVSLTYRVSSEQKKSFKQLIMGTKQPVQLPAVVEKLEVDEATTDDIVELEKEHG